MTRKAEVPGNVLLTQAAIEREVSRVGMALYQIDQRITGYQEEGIWLTELRVKLPGEPGGEMLIVIKAETETSKMVCFHNGATIMDTFVTLAARMKNGSLKWREDKPYGQ